MNILEATLSLCVLTILWGYTISLELPDALMDLIAFGF